MSQFTPLHFNSKAFEVVRITSIVSANSSQYISGVDAIHHIFTGEHCELVWQTTGNGDMTG